MIQEDKQLLLKDLCARLPYDDIYGEVHMQIMGESKPFILKEKPITFDDIKDFMEEDGVIFNIKPYLRPMSSMTEKEKETFNYLCESRYFYSSNISGRNYDYYDWLNSNHFDYHDLIEKGLALEAPEEMYNN